jgi:hypothetical protein
MDNSLNGTAFIEQGLLLTLWPRLIRTEAPAPGRAYFLSEYQVLDTLILHMY